MTMQPYTTEEIKTLLEIHKFTKKTLLDRIKLIEAVVKYGEKLRCVAMHMPVDKETLDRWLTESGAAEAAIQKTKQEITEIEQEISNLEVQL